MVNHAINHQDVASILERKIGFPQLIKNHKLPLDDAESLFGEKFYPNL